jgi:hypothetical protein
MLCRADQYLVFPFGLAGGIVVMPGQGTPIGCAGKAARHNTCSACSFGLAFGSRATAALEHAILRRLPLVSAGLCGQHACAMSGAGASVCVLVHLLLCSFECLGCVAGCCDSGRFA